MNAMRTAKYTNMPASMERPRRPRSAYHIFAEEERSRILQEALNSGELSSLEVSKILYGVKDRRRRKRPGSMGYTDINRKIAAKWKSLSEERKEEYQIAAQKDMRRCQAELKAWKERQEKTTANIKYHSNANTSIEGPFTFPSSTDSLSCKSIPKLSTSHNAISNDCQIESFNFEENGTLQHDLSNGQELNSTAIIFKLSSVLEESNTQEDFLFSDSIDNSVDAGRQALQTSNLGQILSAKNIDDLASKLDNKCIDFICSLNSTPGEPKI